jgi:LysR family transcriptional activator of glutamate synthase operon
MELFQLRYFVSAARLRHFTRAAEENFVSQPSLSLQIANLEREIGARLFVRRGRSVRLTDAGELLLQYAERILNDEIAARQAIQELIGLRLGTLKLWTLPTPGQQLIPPLLAEYRARYPEVEIHLRETVPAGAVAEAVAAGQADIGILHLPYQSVGLSEHLLLREELALIVPEGHPLAGHTCVALADVRNEPFVWAPDAASEVHPLYAACLAAGFAPRIVCETGSAHAMQALVAAGLGIALLPKLAIKPPAGTCVVELAPPRPTRTIAAVWRADRLSHSASAFLDILKGHYSVS